MHQNETKKNLDRSMRQPMRNHCTPRKCSRSCLHHFPTLIPNLLPHIGWAIVGSQCIQCVSDLLNEAPKVRIKLWKTAAYFMYNSTIGIVRYRILQLEAEKYHFILNIGPHVNKYMFQHVLSPIFTKTVLKFYGLTC